MQTRLLDYEDLPAVLAMYQTMLDEHVANGRLLLYPRWDETTVGEMAQYMRTSLRDPQGPSFGLVAAPTRAGGTPVGLIWISISRRPIGLPKCVGSCDLLYIAPAHRRGLVGPRLIRAAAAEATRRVGPTIVECSYMPGASGETLWPRIGLRPYAIQCAFVEEDGTPRPTEDLLARRLHPVRKAS